MVSHTRKPRVGGRQGPNSPRKTRQRPKPKTQMSVCQSCGFRREMSTGFKTLCTGCVVKAASGLQPRKAAVDGGSNNDRCDNTMAAEYSGRNPTQIDFGTRSNDDKYDNDDKAPHMDVNARASAATDVNPGKTAKISAPAQKNISFQSHPSAAALPSSVLGGITPWTPVNSSKFTDSLANMNPAAYYTNPPESMASPASTTSTTVPFQATMGQLPRNFSTATTPQASVNPQNPMGPAYMGPRATFKDPSATINPSGFMNSSAPMNSLAAISSQTTVSPQTVDSHLSIVARPSFTIPPAATSPKANNPTVTMENSSEVNSPMIKTPIPVRIVRARIRANPPRMRKRRPAATRPPRPAINPMVHMLPSPSESSPTARGLPTTTSSSTDRSPPAIIVSPPSTAPPESPERPICTNPLTVEKPQPFTDATSKVTTPASMGPAVTSSLKNESSLVARGKTYTSSPDATNPQIMNLQIMNPQIMNPQIMNPQIMNLQIMNLQANMDLPVFTNLSATQESANPPVEAHLKPYGPPPTNAGNYLYIIHVNYCYSSRAADGIPMKLDSITRKEMIHLEELVTDPPASSTPSFFLPPRSLSIYLLKVYRHEVYFTYPFFNMDKFMDAFAKLFLLITRFDVSSAYLGLGCSDESNPSTPLFQCSLFMILCHAVHFANLEREDKVFASRIFWKCAKFFMTVELLKTSCLAAVQTLLIIAVALNSSSLGGNESKIPAELAYRIARSLGIDNENGQPAGAATGVHDADRQVWYGCVMMNLFSQTMNSKLPLNSGMSKAQSTTTRYQSPIGSVDFDFFVNNVIHIEKLETILEKIRRVREPVLRISPIDGYNSFDKVLPELCGKLCEFIKSLPTEICWGVSGLPNDYIRVSEFDQPRAASNAMFMHLRSMIFRPVLMQMGIDGCLEFNSATCKIDPIIKDKTLMCATSCVNTAVNLIDFLYKRYVVELKSNKEWWWDPYHTSIAGLILVLAQTSATLWSHVQISLVVGAWKACQEMLGYGATDNHFHKDALTFLWATNKNISGPHVLENNYDAMPQIKRSKPTADWNFHRTPYSQFINPYSPFLNPNKRSCSTHSASDSEAPLKVLKPKLEPSVFPHPAAASSSKTAPTATSASSTMFNTMSSATNKTTPSESDAATNAAFSNFDVAASTSPPKSSTAPPPFTASSNSNTAPFTSPLMSGGVPLCIPSASTVHPVPTSSGSGPFSLPLDSSIKPHAASESAAVPYAVTSNSTRIPYIHVDSSKSIMAPYAAASGLGTIPYMASSESTIAPYATSLNWSMAPYAVSSESPTLFHASTSNSSTVPTTVSSCVSPAPCTGPYTAFSDPSATLYTGEFLDANAATWPDFLAFNLPLPSSNTIPSLSPSEINLANFGNIEDIGDLGAETDALFQAYTEGLPLHVYYNPDDDPFIPSNWQS